MGEKDVQIPGFWTPREIVLNTWVFFSSSCAACRRWLHRCKPKWGWSLVMIKMLDIWMHQVLLFWLIYSSYVRFAQWLLLILHFGHSSKVLIEKKLSDVLGRLEKNVYANVTCVAVFKTCKCFSSVPYFWIVCFC